MKASVTIEEALDQRLQGASEARRYLNAVLAEGDPQALKVAIRDVIRARGGIADSAENSQ